MNKKFIVLLFATILSCCALAATSTRYYSAKTGGSDVSIAKWDVQVSDTIEQDVIIRDDSGCSDFVSKTYTISVTSNSAVGVEYTITLQFTKQVPSAITLFLDGQPLTANADRTAFTAAGTRFAPVDPNSTHTHELKIQVYMSPNAEAGDDVLTTSFIDEVTVFVEASQAI